MSAQALWLGTLLAALATPGVGFGQAAPSSGPTTSAVSIGGTGGISAGTMTTGGALGGHLDFDLTDRVTLEGRGLWLQRGASATGLEVSGTMLVTVFSGKTASPYVAFGGGLYRARFDMDSRQLFGRGSMPFATGTSVIPAQAFGGHMIGGGAMSGGTTWMDAATGSTFETREMPMFYASRLGQMAVPLDGRWGTRRFVDPAMTLGFGVRLDVARRFYVRPDVRALVVLGNGRALTLGTATIGFGARF
ncbi:MAG: hypothetical protein IT180_02755 [Acidobacteria bacterium]|nr:hypothetical protein [Acidobacteriota bacterium]